MPSSSRQRWLDERRATLDHFERVFAAARRSGQGSKAVAQQLVQSYVLAISAQFQGFCRPRAATERRALESLNLWRNAIAHQDFDPARLGGQVPLSIVTARRWRSACDRISRALDAVVRAHLVWLGARAPWPVR